jgi:Ras-related protein Rab-2A
VSKEEKKLQETKTMRSNQDDLVYRLVLIGDAAVGKSNLTMRFTEGTFRGFHRMTIGVDFVSKQWKVDGQEVTLEMYDCAGQSAQAPMVNNTFNGAHGGMVVFDITRRETFENVQGWIDRFRQRAGHSPFIVLVGNKRDLESDRRVQSFEAENLARSNGLMYFETSAKEGDNVEAVFGFLAQQIYRSVADATVVRERHGKAGPAAPIKLGGSDKPAPEKKKSRCAI